MPLQEQELPTEIKNQLRIWIDTQAEIDILERKLKDLKKVNKEAFDATYPFVRVLQDMAVRVSDIIITFKVARKSTMTVSYSSLWDVALTKVNTETKKCLEELKGFMSKPSKESIKYLISPATKSSGLYTEGKAYFKNLVRRLYLLFNKAEGAVDNLENLTNNPVFSEATMDKVVVSGLRKIGRIGRI